ncbi:hypothetical protein KP509_01G117300 [Ceratopteris richardii]|nr:hypothetical protein KP509_01G117300 [Ceratopteris richardii]
MHLKVPQLTIATAIVFCHRFYLRQSHARNDRFVIATVCMFLAGKVEETPKLLHHVISAAWEIRHKKDPEMVERIKLKEVYEQEKDLVLTGERLVLSTLEFDLNIYHPYKPLVTAIKKLRVAQNSLAQVAWNFVNDGLRTSLCLQFKPHHVAAGAIFLAAKFLKVKLPSNDKRPWWQEFDVTPRQLEEVSNQMLELYEQHRGLSACAAESNAAKSSAIPPRTPQVAEKRTMAEPKSKVSLQCGQETHQGTSTTDIEQRNLDKWKVALEKQRKFKAEGGDARTTKPELTAEEELLERGMESGITVAHSEVSLYARQYPRDTAHPRDGVHQMHVGESKHTTRGLHDQVLDGGLMVESDTKHWHSYSRECPNAFHKQNRAECGGDSYKWAKSRDWQEGDSKRPRYENIT